jgi:hypothetical protein
MMQASDLSGSAAPHVSDIGPAHRELNKLRKHGLTAEGQKWLETALDPFHDLALDCEGFPDYDSTTSIVQGIRVSLNVVAPPESTASGLPWDCHIASTPYNETWPNIRTSVTNGSDFYTDHTPLQVYATSLGMVTVATKAIADAEDHRTWPSGSTFPAAQGATHQVRYTGLSPVSMANLAGTWTPDRPYTQGRHRVVGAGFEVINTTPPLYRGGLATVYRQNSNLDERTGNAWTDSAALFPSRAVEVVAGIGPPPYVADALNLPGSRQWSAAEGAYIPLTLAGDENPFVQAASREIIMSDDFSPGLGASGRAFLHSTPQAGFGPTPNAMAPKSVNKLHQSGVYFSGLSKETTLTVSLRVFMERAPTRSEPDLVPLARPSPTADPVAWMLYTEAIRLMPPGVILSENFLGGWFRQVVSNVSSVVAPAVSKGVRTVAPIVKKEAKRLTEHAVEELISSAMSRGNARPRNQRQTPRVPKRKK